ncbi:MAG: hypothetical protein U0841_25160 [Chloroflexia bacterium]
MRSADILPQRQLSQPATRPVVSSPSRRLAWLAGAVGVVLAAVALRLPYLDVPISADEGGYATAAYWWARGDTLYQNITITRPQGIFAVFRLIDALGLGSVRGIHLFAAAWVALTTLALLWLVTYRWGRAVGLGAAVLFAVVMATPWLEGYHANAELFMALPLLLGVGALLRADDYPLADRRALGWLLASGVAGAIALLLKPSGIALLPLAALWLARRWRIERATAGEWLTAEGYLLLGWAVGAIPALLHGVMTVPDRYFGAVIFYRLGQDSVVGGALGHQLSYFATNSIYLLLHLPILLLAPFGLTLAAHDGDRCSRAFLAFWLLTAPAAPRSAATGSCTTTSNSCRRSRSRSSSPRDDYFAGPSPAPLRGSHRRDLALLVVLLPVASSSPPASSRDLPSGNPASAPPPRSPPTSPPTLRRPTRSTSPTTTPTSTTCRSAAPPPAGSTSANCSGPRCLRRAGRPPRRPGDRAALHRRRASVRPLRLRSQRHPARPRRARLCPGDHHRRHPALPPGGAAVTMLQVAGWQVSSSSNLQPVNL